MLGRLRMSVEECISRYPTMAWNIFGRKRISLAGAWRNKYDAKYLEAELKAIVEERLREGESDERFRKLAAPSDLCKT